MQGNKNHTFLLCATVGKKCSYYYFLIIIQLAILSVIDEVLIITF